MNYDDPHVRAWLDLPLQTRDQIFRRWLDVPEDDRDKLNRSAQRSPLNNGNGLSGYPYWSYELSAELVAWINLETEIIEAYNDWLETLERRAHRAGRDWDRAEFLRQARLYEAGD